MIGRPGRVTAFDQIIGLPVGMADPEHPHKSNTAKLTFGFAVEFCNSQ